MLCGKILTKIVASIFFFLHIFAVGLERYYSRQHEMRKVILIQTYMRNQIRQAALYCALLLAGMPFARAQQPASDELRVVFRFVAGDDMFYIPWNGNDARLDSLCERLDSAHLEAGSVRVDGYGSDKGIVKIRCNRVKSELILRCGLTENHFTTTNRTGSFNGLTDVVVVTCPPLERWDMDTTATIGPEAERRPERKDVASESTQQPAREEIEEIGEMGEITPPGELRVVAPEVAEETPAPSAESLEPVIGRWYAALNVGIPFFWGDMLSMSADKTYAGFAAGVQGGYRFSTLLAVSLSVDYARGKLGARDYARDYLLAPGGMTWYVPRQQTMERYGDLYSKVSLVNVGLSLDVNINRVFSKRAAVHRFTVWVSPAVYGQCFSTDVYTRVDDERYSDGKTAPDDFSLGLGGALTLRYRLNRSISLQLKNSLSWITDNHFDGIRTPFGKTKHNALWLPQVGIVWSFK